MIRACLLTACIGLFSAASFAQPPQYSLQAVPPPNGFSSVGAAVIADSTDFVGRATAPEGTVEFFLWTQKGGYSKIASPDGSAISSISAINSSDSIVGLFADGAFFWSPKDGSSLIIPPAGYSAVIPTGVNDRDMVVGSVQSDKGLSESFVWTREKGMRISPAERQTSAVAINNNGTVAGNAFKAVNKYQAFTADKKGARPVGILGLTSTAKAFSINNFGTVGMQFSANAFDVPQLALWSKTAGVQLSGSTAQPLGLTDFNDILAFGDTGSFLWNPMYGSFDLTELIVPGSPQVSQMFIGAAAGNRVLGGQAMVDGTIEAVVLTPIQ
jgi:hypothetical protein